MSSTTAPVMQGGSTLKKKKSLKQLLIPTRQKSQTRARKQSLPSAPAPIEDPILTAVPTDHVLQNSTVGSTVEPPSASSSRAPSSVLSEDSSQQPLSSSRRGSRQADKDIVHATEQMVRSLNSTGLGRSGRSRASTLTNFSKPYGLLQEYKPVGSPQPARKNSQQNLNMSVKNHRPFNRVFTDGQLSMGLEEQHQHPRTLSNPPAPVGNIDTSAALQLLNFANKTDSRSSEQNHSTWIPTHEDVIKGIRSGQSSRSSPQGSKHSSVFTKVGSIADTMTDTEILDEQKDTISVNEVIDLYADLDEEESATSPETAHANERSIRIAEAMAAPIGSLPTPGLRKRTSTAGLSNAQRVRDVLHYPPSLQNPTATHDHYGFRKFSRDVAEDDYNNWYQQYSKFQSRRNAKWHSLLSECGMSTTKPLTFPAPSSKMQRFIRKGIPPAWRGDAWFFYAGGAEMLARHPNHYVNLVVKSQSDALSRNDKEAVERDLHRTFPDNLHFKSELASTSNQIIETPIMSALRRLLCAFAIDHPRIGYCQSLNFIAGLLLLFLTEEKAYWMLHIMTTQLLPGTHELSLEGANVDLWVLMLALKQANPGVWAKVGGDVEPNSSRLPPISLCTTSWFMSVFIGTLPIESVLRVWDVLFYEGSKTLFRVALAIFKSGEVQIKSVADPMETFQVVQSLPRRMVDIGNLFEIAFSRGEVGRRWIEKKRSERRAFYAKERSIEKARRESRDAGPRRATTSHGESLKSPTTPDTIAMASPEANEDRSGYWGNTMAIARPGAQVHTP